MKQTKKILSFILVLVFLFAVGYSVYKDNKGKLFKESTIKTSAKETKSNKKTDTNLKQVTKTTKPSDTKDSSNNTIVSGNKNQKQSNDPLANIKVEENGSYNTKLEVAKYIATYNKLPKNYIRKNDAMEKGWDPKSGNLDKVLKGYSIGGDTYSNFEGTLPKGNGLKYIECDIDYNGGKRNAKRIVFSNKGNIYYTEDHYNTFEKLK